MSSNSINHGLMTSAESSYIKGSRLNCSGFRIRIKKTDV